MVEIKQAKLFAGLPDSEVRSIEKQLKIVKHPAGHEIVVRGEGGVGFMVITDGTVTVKTGQGKTRKLGPGDSFGEMALLDNEGRSATITADSEDRKSTRLNSSHSQISYAVFCLKKKKRSIRRHTPLLLQDLPFVAQLPPYSHHHASLAPYNRPSV